MLRDMWEAFVQAVKGPGTRPEAGAAAGAAGAAEQEPQAEPRRRPVVESRAQPQMPATEADRALEDDYQRALEEFHAFKDQL